MKDILSHPLALPTFSIIVAAVFVAVHSTSGQWREPPNMSSGEGFDTGFDSDKDTSGGGMLTDEGVRPFTYVPTSSPVENNLFVPVPTTIVVAHNVPQVDSGSDLKWDIPFGEPTPDPALLFDPGAPPGLVNKDERGDSQWGYPPDYPTPDPAQLNQGDNGGGPANLNWNIPLGQPTPDPAMLSNPATSPSLKNDGSPIDLSWGIPLGEPTPDPALLRPNNDSPINLGWGIPLGEPTPDPALLRPNNDSPINLGWGIPLGEPTPDPALLPPNNNSPINLGWGIPLGEPTPDPALLPPNNDSPIALKWSIPYGMPTPDPAQLIENVGSPIVTKWEPPYPRPLEVGTSSPSYTGYVAPPSPKPTALPGMTVPQDIRGETAPPRPTSAKPIAKPVNAPVKMPTIVPAFPTPTLPYVRPTTKPASVPLPPVSQISPVKPVPIPGTLPPVLPPPISSPPPPVPPPPVPPPPVPPPLVPPPPVSPPPVPPPPVPPPPVPPPPVPPPPPPVPPPPVPPAPGPAVPGPAVPGPAVAGPGGVGSGTTVWTNGGAGGAGPTWYSGIGGFGGLVPILNNVTIVPHNQVFLEGCNPLVCTLNEAADFHSMSNEDESIYEIFYTNPIKCCRVVVEIGAGDGDRYSFSHFFEQGLKWRSLLIEANPEVVKQLKVNRPNATAINGAFCESSHLLYNNDAFSALGGSVEVTSELHSPPQIGVAAREVPCLSMDTVFADHGITKVDVLVVRLQGDALAYIRAMDWTVRVDIWVILMHGATKAERDQLVRTVLKGNEYVQAEWDIKRWCSETGQCLNNEVFLRKGFNPLPCEIQQAMVTAGVTPVRRLIRGAKP